MKYVPTEAVKLAKQKYHKGDVFTLPDLYDRAWSYFKGHHGSFGNKFNNYINECACGIKRLTYDESTGRALYKII